ncbi:MAG: hypothetical protein M3022_09780 [Actinomycetota bacterium]|nr:hypothetical protein [Actinomycetota bacterium]
MDEPEPTPDALLRRQQAHEEAERVAAADAVSDEQALTHERRADKARYLREKLEAQGDADQREADQSRAEPSDR